MPKVYIDSLSIKNFGPFYGEHVFNFKNLEGKNAILIGGKNGAGKTHILRAIYLALIGEDGIKDIKKFETTNFSFNESLNRRAKKEGVRTSELKILLTEKSIEYGRPERKLEIKRKITFNDNSPEIWESSAVNRSINDEERTEEDEEIQKLRDSLLPRHLARFFFFDAEQNQIIDLSANDIVEGISKVLGIWIYNELENSLAYCVTKLGKHTKNIDKNKIHSELITLNSKITEKRELLKLRNQELKECQDELNNIEYELKRIDDELKNFGTINPEELNTLQVNRDKKKQLLSNLEEEIKKALEYSLPIHLLGKLKYDLNEALLSEEIRRDWENAKSTVEPKIPQVKNDVFGNPPKEYQLPDNIKLFYEERLEKALHRLFNPPPKGMANKIFITDNKDSSVTIRRKLSLYKQGLINLQKTYEEIDKVESDIKYLDSKIKHMLNNSSALEKGKKIYEKKGMLEQKKNDLENKIINITTEIKNLEKELENLKSDESKIKEKINMIESQESLIKRICYYKDAADKIREKAANKMREQISEIVSRIWLEITDRENEFEKMEFNEKWECYLYTYDGNKIHWDDINPSAGQRQVRILAFYEALKRLAKTVPPFVVDTPLARLDKEVRESVLEKLYLSGHQSIILSTNAEIGPDSPLFEKISNNIARVYTLNLRENLETKDYDLYVSKDYFGRQI
jgi:DNA sulfur modification protein DndD